MPQDTHQVPYDFVCKSIGRILLESQFQLELLTQRVGELQKNYATLQQKAAEGEAKLRELEARLSSQ
jgi:hypothetical protein